jgi:hypothetical protein
MWLVLMSTATIPIYQTVISQLIFHLLHASYICVLRAAEQRCFQSLISGVEKPRTEFNLALGRPTSWQCCTTVFY